MSKKEDEEVSIEQLGPSITAQTLRYWEDFLACLFKYPSLCYFFVSTFQDPNR